MTDEFPEPHMDALARAMVEDDIIGSITPVEHEGLCERLERAEQATEQIMLCAHDALEAAREYLIKPDPLPGGLMLQINAALYAVRGRASPEAATTIRTQAAELERLRGELERWRPSVVVGAGQLLSGVTAHPKCPHGVIVWMGCSECNEAARALSDRPPETGTEGGR